MNSHTELRFVEGKGTCLVETTQRVIATQRDESDSCEAGTPGCCIEHKSEATSGSCETW